ncbi:hypothetical protein NPN17_25305, partial [Vibrio parahaemolyticus]
ATTSIWRFWNRDDGGRDGDARVRAREVPTHQRSAGPQLHEPATRTGVHRTHDQEYPQAGQGPSRSIFRVEVRCRCLG